MNQQRAEDGFASYSRCRRFGISGAFGSRIAFGCIDQPCTPRH